MSTATVTPPPAPANAPTAGPARMTAEEFGLKYSGRHVEYVGGEVKEVPMAGGRHGKVCFKCAFALGQFVESNRLGHLFINDTFVKVPTKDDPERVYGPDVCLVSYERLPKDATIPDGLLPVTPQLVVEVRSPSGTWAKVFGKVSDYLGADVTAVVVIDFATRTASVYRNDPKSPQQILQHTDELTLPDVLPGFAVSVAALFE